MEPTYHIVLKNFGGTEPSAVQRTALEGAMREAIAAKYGTARKAQEAIGGFVHGMWDSDLEPSAEAKAFEAFTSQIRAQLRPRMHFAWDISFEPNWTVITGEQVPPQP